MTTEQLKNARVALDVAGRVLNVSLDELTETGAKNLSIAIVAVAERLAEWLNDQTEPAPMDIDVRGRYASGDVIDAVDRPEFGAFLKGLPKQKKVRAKP